MGDISKQIKTDLDLVKQALEGKESPEAEGAAERLFDYSIDHPDYFTSEDEETLIQVFGKYGLMD